MPCNIMYKIIKICFFLAIEQPSGGFQSQVEWNNVHKTYTKKDNF